MFYAKPKMSLRYGTASTDDELHQIIKLQRDNHTSSVSPLQAREEGFVTVMHSFPLLKEMNKAAPQIIARDSERVVGYALVMLKSFSEMIPVLQPMFDKLRAVKYEQRTITDHSFYVMGQICIDRSYRGQGVFDALYQKHEEIYGGGFELCVTSVSTSNVRSMRAHERVGFRIVHTFRDAMDEWNILVLRFSKGSVNGRDDRIGNYDVQENALP